MASRFFSVPRNGIHHHRILSWILIIAILLIFSELYGQTCTVIGTITYRNNTPAANVFVSIGDRYRYTDVGGRYKIDGVTQGRQHMIIKKGRRVLWQGDVTIGGRIATVNRILN